MCNIFYSEEDSEFYTIPDGDKATTEQVNEYYKNIADKVSVIKSFVNFKYNSEEEKMLETIIYNAIKTKLNSENAKQTTDVMNKYMNDFCNQFSLRKLQELDLTNPDIETLVFYLIYQIQEQKQHHHKSLLGICKDFEECLLNNIITISDINNIINKNK